MHIANLLASSVLKLSIKGDIITQCAIISLELLEAETAHLNSSVSRSWARLWMQVMNPHLLIVCERVLHIAIVQCQVSTVILAVARWAEHDSIRHADSR